MSNQQDKKKRDFLALLLGPTLTLIGLFLGNNLLERMGYRIFPNATPSIESTIDSRLSTKTPAILHKDSPPTALTETPQLLPEGKVPTVTLSPPRSCLVDDMFHSFWKQYENELGCGIRGIRTETITLQQFQGGYLLWLKSEDQKSKIFLMYNGNSQWTIHPDDWDEGKPRLACEDALPYDSPENGFGILWCSDNFIKSALKAPIQKEEPDDSAKRQFFEHGQILRASGRVFILFKATSTWIEF